MKVVKIVAQSRLANVECLSPDCPLNFTGPEAEGKAYSHVEKYGHKVKVTNAEYLIYDLKEAT